MPTQGPSATSRGFRFTRSVVRLLLRSQFRTVEVVGAGHVPADGAVLLVANHSASLVDPMALLHASPRPASFLAKAPLWKSKLLAPFLDAAGAIPVYRPQDEEENEGRTARANIETFRRCRKRLAEGGSIALFPEGLSQPHPRLLPLRTGAARIALDARVPVTVCPAGIVYEAGEGDTRGTLLVLFGEPIEVDGWEAYGSRRAAITALTRRVEASLKHLLAEASSQAELGLVRALRLIWDQERGHPPPRTLVDAHGRDQAFAEALERLRREHPDELQALRAEADAWTRALDEAGIPPRSVGRRHTVGPVLRFLGLEAPLLLVTAPLALFAGVVTWPMRQIGDVVALRSLGGTEDVRGLCRMLGGGLFLALSMVAGTVVGALLGWWWLLPASLLGLPLLLAFFVVWRDHFQAARSKVRAWLLLAGSDLHETLLEERHALYERLMEAQARLDEAS